MNACHCRNARYTKYPLPFSQIQRHAESKLPNPCVLLCCWQTLGSVYSAGAALWSTRSTGRAPLSQGSRGQLPPPAPGGQNRCLGHSGIQLKTHRDAHNPSPVLPEPLLCSTSGISVGYLHVELHKLHGLHI